MSESSKGRIVVLGSDQGWHADQLRQASRRMGLKMVWEDYQTLSASVAATFTPATTRSVNADASQSADRLSDGPDPSPCKLHGRHGRLDDALAIVPRTMPAGTLEAVTFRLAMMHAFQSTGGVVINPPRALELAIDKYATLVEVARLGYPVPATAVVQTRDDALAAFDQLGGDCVVKPIFGGEGRGVMRIQDRQLAWTVFTTLQQLGAVAYVQAFVPPGGSDLRLLCLGDRIHAIRRTSTEGFRTNVSAGGDCQRVALTDHHRRLAIDVMERLGLVVASVDLLECEVTDYKVVEVNAIPGWRGAQRVIDDHIGLQFLQAVMQRVTDRVVAY